METFMCRKHVCVGVKKFVTLKVHLFHEDQMVYKVDAHWFRLG